VFEPRRFRYGRDARQQTVGARHAPRA
jgi:hypothetical protein